jgi:hypothetical protein
LRRTTIAIRPPSEAVHVSVAVTGDHFTRSEWRPPCVAVNEE